MAVNKTVMAVPPDLSDEQSLRLFLWAILEQLDILLGNRAPEIIIKTSSDLVQLESILNSIVIKTTNYTVTSSDFVVVIDSSANPVTVTLPSNANKRYVIKCKDDTNGAYVVSTGLLDDSPTPFQLYKHETIAVHFDGTNWWIV
jgi:hypothetical protein